MKTSTKFISFFVLVFSLLVLSELLRPKPLDWRQTFSKDDKIPYGNYALFSSLSSIFPRCNVETADLPIATTLKKRRLHNSAYLIIARSFSPDSLDFAALLQFVKEGNTAFIAAESFSNNVCDTLGFSTDYYLNLEIGYETLLLSLINPHLDSTKYFPYKSALISHYFSGFQSKHISALGKNSENNLTYIYIPFGKGKFLLNSTPAAFTNYYFLDAKTSSYATGAFSYISDGRLIWDEFYKDAVKKPQSPLRFIFAQNSLLRAWQILLVGAVLFVVFRAKRRQRIIPEIAPPANATLDFINTISRLYFEQKNNRNIAEKRILYLLEFIRHRLNLQIDVYNTDSINRLAEKSGIEQAEIRSLFDAIIQTRNSAEIYDESLIELNSRIEKFYKFVGV